MHSLGVLFKPDALKNIEIENNMKNIYIHIGMHRTGTTSFQNFLELNVEKLKTKKIGVFIPGQNHNANSSEYFMMESRSRAQEYLDLKEFLSQDYESFIISAEELSRFDYDEITPIKNILSLYKNAEVSIIGCFRQPNDYVDSAGAKLIESSGYKLNSLVSCVGLIPKYSGLVAWDAHFSGRLSLFKFSGDTLTTILEKIGISGAEFAWPERENSSKCLEYIALVASVNDLRFIQSKQLLDVFCRGAGNNKFVLPQEVAASIGSEVNKEVRILNEALGGMLDDLNVYGRPKMHEYSDQQFLASCLRYLLESVVATIPAILTSGALAYSNTRQQLDDNFDPFGYLIRNFDLCASAINPMEHYKAHGKSEGRTSFDSKIIENIERLGG